MIDLRSLNTVAVDPVGRRVRVGGGALLRDMDAATQEHGLAVPAGQIGHTGIGGLALGGGMGWLSRVHGLTVDHLLGAQVVLADGRVVRASADEHPDLFPVGPVVSFGMFFFGLDDGPAILRTARDLMPELPGAVGFQIIALCAPFAPFVPQEVRLRPGWR